MKTSAPGYAFAASGTLPCRGIATSSRPKNTFWKPPGLPGCTTQATEGVSRPARHNFRCYRLLDELFNRMSFTAADVLDGLPEQGSITRSSTAVRITA